LGQECFTIVAAVNDMDILNKNLCSSPEINNGKNQIIIKRNYRAASLAYNDAIEDATNEIILFVHQDVYLPENWFSNFKKSLSYLEKEKINWGVLGCFGSKPKGPGGVGRVYTNGMGLHGREIDKPEPVQTLDEIVLVIKKSSGLRFDPTLPHFHMYGTDICMSAREKGMMSYVFPAFCIHNTNQILRLPEEFYECYRHIKRRWGKYVPIYTSCMRISRFDSELRLKRVREVYARLRHKEILPTYRVEDPRLLMRV
jgi:Glycosyltransferase like family